MGFFLREPGQLAPAGVYQLWSGAPVNQVQEALPSLILKTGATKQAEWLSSPLTTAP